MGGVSFDRAADYYDVTRGLPAGVDRRVADLLATDLSGRGTCLEIGAGTGRIALPLAQRGIELLAADLAPAMLARLVANAGGNAPFPLMTADVTSLPLADASVEAVLGCHVLHLIPNWRTALDEACRVLRPGGLLLVDFGGPTPKPWSESCDAILERHGLRRARPGVSSPEPVSDYLVGRAHRRALRAIEFQVEVSLDEELANWEDQLLAWTWAYSAVQIREACREIRASADALGWPLHERIEVPALIQWWAFDLLS